MSTTRTPPRTAVLRAAIGAGLIVPALGGLLAAGTAAAAPPAVPAQAPAAGTVVTSIDNGGGLSVRAAAGKANAISVSLTNITFTVRDTGDVVVPGAGCTAVDANVVRCTAFGQRVSINTGDLADVVNAPLPLPTTVQAGEGDDTVTTGTAADSLQGALGNDRLTAGAGADRLDGNRGRDTLTGQEGRDTLLGGGRADEADVLSGGPDTDLADYSSRDLALTVSLNDLANDGEPGENDNVGSDVEEIEGGDGDDRLTGSNIATVVNRLVGNLGRDTLIGQAGIDRMFSGEGNDVLDGGPGNDDLDGGPGGDSMTGGLDRDEVSYSGRTVGVSVDLDDVNDDGQSGEFDNVRSDVEDITGGTGADQLTGSSAANRLLGNGGDDTLDGGVGPDLLGGGGGFDRVTYKTRTNTIIANIDGVDNDGVTGEKDNITLDVESIEGGLDDDLLGGADFDRADNLVGGPGDDVLLGFEGDDDLFGNGGSDGLNCGPGGGDVGNGGAGNDRSNGCESTIGVEDVTP